MTRNVRLTSADRVVFPDAGITKADLAAYYGATAEVVVPHLAGRPFTMKRYREGLSGDVFFQKDAPRGMPAWIPTFPYPARQRSGETRIVSYPVVNEPAALAWMVQMNCIDLNVWLSRVDRPDRPDHVVFDLDPPDGRFADAVRVAHHVRALLDDLGLEAFPKTSGGSGVHVYVPVSRRVTYADSERLAGLVAERIERQHGDLATTAWRVEKRHGRVLIDWRQNGLGRTMATVYSVRPRPTAPVSTPLRWDELTPVLDPATFTMDVVRARIERHGDLFAPVLAGGQTIGRALTRLARA